MNKIYTSIIYCCVFTTNSFAQSISLTGSLYTQDFNTLSNTAGSTTNNLTIAGWYLNESGGGARDNEQYAVDAGGSTTGDMYSYGAAAATDRAVGELRSGTLIPVFGVAFTNNTGAGITTLTISFTGEQWRLGTVGRTDQLSFEYSTNATNLTTGTWTAVPALNFTTPATVTAGAKDGNAAANRTTLTSAITSLSIANGAGFWIRWVDTDATGADDGLAIDDFSITPSSGAVPLKLTSFSVVKESKTGKLSWTTAQEINTQSFIIERAPGNGAFKAIATINAAGNSDNALTYSFTDMHPLPGVNIYRLRMLDKDNKITFSETRRVNFDKQFTYTVYPNPAQHELLLSADKIISSSTILQLINAKGIAITQQQLPSGVQSYKLNVEKLTAGVYYLRITNAVDRPVVLRFVKQ
jgi:hypothetical protein